MSGSGDIIGAVLGSRPGTTLFAFATPCGDGDSEPFPGFFAKVGRGEARGRMIGERPRIATTASVLDVKGVALVPVAFRLGSYPRPFLAWLNHHEPEMPSPLETPRDLPRYPILLFESGRVARRAISTGNNPRFWEALLGVVRRFPAWSPGAFADAVADLEARYTPERLWRIMQAQPEAN